MIRYQIQSEYGLSDPELYAAPGEEDDPEALLEGVAMAGLVGVLRQLGDLAEFAAEIFHDLHEDVMATASRGHGLMLRLQQLEAEFPAVEKAIISQNDHSNYPHDDGVEWHANLQLRQNMITQGDMPRFILDSYEECRGPPHLFTLDKFDVAGAGASLKRYSDPSFFKIEHASNMTETDVVIEKKPRRIKKKAMRWRKGVTLESLLIANSGPQTTSKDRTSRKVPPRTTKLKSRHPRSPDHKTVGRICSEHLQEIISSQQKILSSYCTRHYHVKFRSTHSSETTSPYGELDNFGTLVQSSGKLELTKVVPLNESDTVESTSAPTNGSAYLEAGDKQFLGKQDGPTELKEVCNMSLVEQNCMAPHSEKLQDCPDFLVRESNRGLQSAHEEKLLLGAVPADHDVDGCRLDDIASDQDNLVDALNNMDSEGEADPEMKNEWDFSANVEGNELNCQSKEGENALDAQFQEVGPAINSSCGLNGSCNGGEQTCVDLPLISDSAPSVASTNNGPNSGSPPGIRLNGVDWTNDEEPFNDEDLMDVSSSSSTVSDNADMQTNDDLVGCQQYQEGANHSVNDDHAAVIESFDKWSPTTYGSLNGLAISNNDYTDKAYHLEHDQNFELDGTSMLLSKSNNVSEDEEDINVGIADDLFLHPTTNQEEMQESKKEFDKGKSLDTCTSPGKLASLPNKDHGMCMNDLEMDNVSVSEDIVVDTTPMGLDPDIHDHLDVDLGSAPTHSSMRYNKLYESHDDEIVEDVHSVPDRDLSTPYKFVAEDHQIVVLEEGTFSASLNTCKEDSMQASVMAREFSYAQELPGIIEGVSPSQDDTEAYVGETLAPSSCVLNDDTEPLKIGVPLAPTTSYLSDNSSSCVEQHTLTEMEDTVECGKFVVAEESTANKFTDDVAPPEEEFTDASKCTEKAEVLITNSTKEDSRHDSQLESSSPFREGMETVKATCRNLEEVDKSSEHISKKSMLQPVNIHPFIEMEIAGEKCSDSDDIQFISSARFLEESDYQEELLEEASVNAEVLSWCNSDKDGAVSLKSNTVAKQPADVNQDLVWGMSAQDSSSTNPFMDPAYTTSHAQIYPSPSMNYQPFSEEQDVLSELLTQDDNTEAAAGSLWEPATPPDEAPLSPEVLTEDFRSFCHEYHEIDFTAGTEGCHGEPASDSKNMSNAFVDSEPDLPCSVSALPVVLDHEACVHSKFGSRHAECSSATDIEANTSMPFSSKEGLENETPGVDSHLKSRESFSDNQNPELDMLSVPVNLQQEQHDLSGVDSHNSSRLVDKENTTEECCSPSSNNVLVKKELEIRENLIPHSSINEKVGELDVPPSNDAPVAPEVGARVLNEYDGKDVPCCSSKEIDAITSSNSVLVQGSEVCVFGEFDSPVVPPSADVNEDNLEASALRTYFRAEQEPECCVSGEHDSQRVQPSSLDEKTDELDGPPLNNAVVLDQEPDVCSSSGLNSRITPYSSTDEKIYEPNFPLRSSVLVDPESEDYVSGGLDSQVTPCYLVKDKIDESEAAQSNSILPEELKQAAHATPELDSQVAPCSLKDDNVGEIDGPPSCNVWVESEKEAYQLSPGPPPTVPFQNDSYEDSQKPPPLPPLQWRLGRPRLGLLSTEGCMPEPARRIDSVFQASNQEMDTRLGLLDRMNRSIEPVPSQVIKEDKYQNSMMDDNDRNGEFGRLSTSLAVTDVARTEHGLPFSEGSENIKQQGPMSSPAIGVEEHLDDTGVTSATGVEDNDRNVGFGRLLTSLAETDVARTEHGLPFSEGSESTKQQGPMSSSAIGVEEHLDDTGVTSATGVEEHLDDSGVTHGTDLYVSYPLLPFPTYEKQGPQPCILSSDTEHPSLTHPTASKDDKSVDVYNTAGSMVSTSTTGHVSENRCYQQDQCGESFSENPDHKEHITNASEDKSVKQQPSTSEEPSDTANHSAPGSLLEEGNNQEKQNAKSSENKPGGSLPSAESMAIQDYPHDEHNLEREKMQQPSGPGPFVLWPGDRNNFASGLDEDSSVHADQPPLMGWTVGPQMIHPKYGILIEESQFVPNITDNHLIRKPISIKNIPRNPLVDAVAAHDRSSMRKVSELAPPTDKLKPNERNLLLEQIRNKTFNLKPVGSAKPTAMRSPARANTRNLKVAAIIEKANAIRQAVGSDDEDADNWSDS